MQFSRRDNFYSVSRITGPTHNYLALELAEQDGALEARIEALEPRGECRHAPIDPRLILAQVVRGVDDANARFGTRLGVRTVRYVPNDTGPEQVYAALAFVIVARIHAGGFGEPAAPQGGDA